MSHKQFATESQGDVAVNTGNSLAAGLRVDLQAAAPGFPSQSGVARKRHRHVKEVDGDSTATWQAGKLASWALELAGYAQPGNHTVRPPVRGVWRRLMVGVW